MLLVNGIPTVQAATVIFGLPFSFVVIFAMTGLLRALQTESMRPRVVAADDRRTLGQRLRYAVTYADADAARRFLDDVATPALETAAEHLASSGAHVTVTRSGGSRRDGDRGENGGGDGITPVRLRLAIDDGDFVYEVRPVRRPMPSYGFAVTADDGEYYRMEVVVGHGSLGYDIIDYKRKQIIADLLHRLDEHVDFLERTHAQRASTVARMRESMRRFAGGRG